MQSVRLKTKLKYRAYRYSVTVIKFIKTLPKDFTMQVIAKQLLRSATSVGANIIEAQASSSKKDFAKFFTYSLKSANESLYWLSLLKDTMELNTSQLGYLLAETQEIAKILGSSVLTLKGKKKF